MVSEMSCQSFVLLIMLFKMHVEPHCICSRVYLMCIQAGGRVNTVSVVFNILKKGKNPHVIFILQTLV